MKTAAQIAFLYVVFAFVATVANIGAQALTVYLYSGIYTIELSILVGTATGLPIKYVLEKRHIFDFETDGLAHDGKLFTLYCGIGVLTTALFWGIEYGFQQFFGTDAMRYAGGILGLALGYIVKYRLDKRFVFVSKAACTIET